MKRIQKVLMKNSDPDGIRIHDPNIKSVVLYQLSYEIKNHPTLHSEGWLSY